MKLTMFIFTVCCAACGAGALAVEQAEVAVYAAQEQACVAQATTKAAADACIAAVKQGWCGDAGALATAGACGAQDAGGQ